MERIFFCKIKKIKKIHFRGLAPKFDPWPHVPRNLSRAHRGAHDPEKISEIPLMVAEKIEFEKKIWRPLAAKPEVILVRWPHFQKAIVKD